MTLDFNLDFGIFLMSLLAISLIYTCFFFLSYLFVKKLKLRRVRGSLILILIALSLKVFFYINNIEIDSKIANSILYLVFFFSVINLLDTLVKELFMERSGVNVPKILHDVVAGLTYFVALMMVLKMEMGINLGPLIATSAILSMVLGLALQDTLTNLIGGFVIYMEKPFKTGDWVLVNGVEGKIMEINWRTVKLLTFNNDFLVIPNSGIVKDSIINFNYPTSNHIISMEIGTDYSDAPNKVKNVLISVLKETKNVLEFPYPEVRLKKYNDFSIDYEVRAWINDYSKKKVIENDFMTNVWYAFKRESISIPYPIREIYHHQVVKEVDENDIGEIYEILKKIDFFKDFEEKILMEISKNVNRKLYGKGEKVFSKGESGDSFFIIDRGTVSVLVNGKELARLHKGNFFGEMSLFTGKTRNATIKIIEDAEFLVLDKEGFSEVLMKNQNIAEKISSVMAKREIENEERKKSISQNNYEIARNKENEKLKQKSILSKIKKVFNI